MRSLLRVSLLGFSPRADGLTSGLWFSASDPGRCITTTYLTPALTVVNQKRPKVLFQRIFETLEEREAVVGGPAEAFFRSVAFDGERNDAFCPRL